MKKLLTPLLMSFTLFSSNVFSQITISQSDIVGVGDTLFFANDTSFASISPGNAGAMQVWDFSSLITFQIDTQLFIDPSATPYQADFPSSNLVLHEEDSFWIFLNSSANDLSIVGFAGDLGSGGVVPVQVSPGNKFIKFSSTYQSNYSNLSATTFQFYIGDTLFYTPPAPPMILDSVRVVTTNSKLDTIDGYGEIQTPLGTYWCLRQKSIEYRTDSLFNYISNPPPPGTTGWNFFLTNYDTTTTYRWWANGLGFSVLEIVDSSGVITDISWIQEPPIPSGVASIENPNATIIYPNPASYSINFELKQPRAGKHSVLIYDRAGQVVLEKRISSSHMNRGKFSVKLSNLPDGIYFYGLKDQTGNIVVSGRFVMAKR